MRDINLALTWQHIQQQSQISSDQRRNIHHQHLDGKAEYKYLNHQNKNDLPLTTSIPFGNWSTPHNHPLIKDAFRQGAELLKGYKAVATVGTPLTLAAFSHAPVLSHLMVGSFITQSEELESRAGVVWF